MLTLIQPRTAANPTSQRRYDLRVCQVEQAMVVTLKGELRLPEVARFRNQLHVLTAWRRQVTVFDVSGLAFISNAAMDALVEYRDAVAQHGGTALLAEPRPELREVFVRTGLHHLLPIIPTDAPAAE